MGDGLRRNKEEDFLNATGDNKKKNSLYLSGLGERANRNLRATQAEVLNQYSVSPIFPASFYLC